MMKFTLKRKHSYYAQVQGQLGVERMVPFSSIYQEGVPSGAHSTRQGLLAFTARFFRLVLRKSLEACFKVKAINTCRNEQSSPFKWTILY